MGSKQSKEPKNQDNPEETLKSSVIEVSGILSSVQSFSNSNKVNIGYRSWVPKTPKAVVFIIHGLHEHGGRYGHVATYLAGHQFAVFAHDFIGHGRSDGEKALIPSFDELVSDAVLFIRNTANSAQYQKLPVFVLAHSTGTVVCGLATTRLITEDPQLSERIKAVVVTGPLVIPGVDAGSPLGMTSLYCLNSSDCLMVGLSTMMASLDPMGRACPIDLDKLTHHEEISKANKQDNLGYSGWVRNKTAFEIRKGIESLYGSFSSFKYPVLILQGEEDTICHVKSSEIWHASVASTQKQRKMYPGMYHEIMNEVDHLQVLGEILHFMKSNLRS